MNVYMYALVKVRVHVSMTGIWDGCTVCRWCMCIPYCIMCIVIEEAAGPYRREGRASGFMEEMSPELSPPLQDCLPQLHTYIHIYMLYGRRKVSR